MIIIPRKHFRRRKRAPSFIKRDVKKFVMRICEEDMGQACTRGAISGSGRIFKISLAGYSLVDFHDALS